MSGFSHDIINKLQLTFPESYCQAKIMADIAVAIKEEEGSSLCILPFCHTVEAEAMGGIINLSDGTFDPRAKEYAYQLVEELLDAPAMDFSQGRIRAVLEAGALLKQQGQKVALEASGLFTTLNCLIDSSEVFKAWRKNAAAVEAVMAK